MNYEKYKMTPSFEDSDLDNAYVEGFNNALKLCDSNIADFLDWTETLLCNGRPLPTGTQGDWDAAVKKWRDEKHDLSRNLSKKKTPTRYVWRIPDGWVRVTDTMTIPELNLKIQELQHAADEIHRANIEAEREPKAKWMALNREIDELFRERERLKNMIDAPNTP